MFFFEIKEPKDRPNVIRGLVYLQVSSTPSRSKKNSLRSAHNIVISYWLWARFFESLQEGGSVAIKGLCGEAFSLTIP